MLAQNLVRAAAMPMQLVNAAIVYLRREVPRGATLLCPCLSPFSSYATSLPPASRSLPSPMLVKSYRKAQKMSGERGRRSRSWRVWKRREEADGRSRCLRSQPWQVCPRSFLHRT
eukprot:130591-Hanusia_phi.AAC.1